MNRIDFQKMLSDVWATAKIDNGPAGTWEDIISIDVQHDLIRIEYFCRDNAGEITYDRNTREIPIGRTGHLSTTENV